MTSKVLAIILGELLCLSSALAQSGRSGPDPISSGQKPPVPCKEDKQEPPPTLNVMFNVLVTDSVGRPMQDVVKDDFKIFEDSNPQQITVFDKREGALSYGVFVDTSGSLRSRLDQVVSAARALVQANESQDELFLVRFISSDRIELTQDWTSDKALLTKKLDDFFIEGGQTAIIDAVYQSAQHLYEHLKANYVRQRSALVLITDGEDRMSYYKERQLLSLLRKLDTHVFVIGFTNEVQPASSKTKAIRFLLTLTQTPGGRVVFVSHENELLDAVKTIRQEPSAQYLIGYEPANRRRDNLTRKIRIDLADKPGRGQRLAGARMSYVALCQ